MPAPPPTPATAARAATCVFYGRLSKGDESIEAAEARGLAYCRAQHFTVAATPSDPDTTGDTDDTPFRKRKGGAEVLRLLETGAVGHLVVTKVDRIARRASFGLRFIEDLRAQGVVLHIADQGGCSAHSGSPSGWLQLAMLFVFAEYELREIRDRTKKRLDHKRAAGELVGHVPFGFVAAYTFGCVTELHSRALSPAEVAARAADLGHPLVCKRLHGDAAEQDWLRWLVRERYPAWPARTPVGASLPALAHAMNNSGLTPKGAGARLRVREGAGWTERAASATWQVGHIASVITSRYTAALLDGSLPPELLATTPHAT
jgi:DNA invertase Pin-like site-specific DNA recombinase